MNFKPLLLGSFLLAACGPSVSQPTTSDVKSTPSVAILQYHHVDDNTPAVTSIRPEQFRAHLQFLKDNNFTVLDIVDAHQRIEEGRPIPAKAVVITFDDGYDNVYENAADVLAEFGMPYAVFVNPDLMAESPSAYMSWEQLRDLQQRGATILNHGQTHAHLIRRKEGETEQQWQQRMHYDVVSAQQAIDENLGPQPKYFAYPFGEYDPELEQLLTEWGFLGFAQHSGPWSEYSDPQAITRFPASGRYANLSTLKAKLTSLPMPVANYQPQNPLLSHDNSEPEVRVTLASTQDIQTHALRCYQGAAIIEPKVDSEGSFVVELANPLPIGRSRINCTAPNNAGNHYYWFSVPFIRPDASGSWPD